MIYLHKILPIFFLPIMIFISLVVLGIVFNRKKLIICSLVLLYLFSTPIFSGNLFSLIEGTEMRKLPNEVGNADAIVVLSGMIGFTQTKNGVVPQWGDATDRFFGGIELMKAGKANQLIFTGAKMPWNKNKETEGEILKDYAVEFGLPENSIKISGIVETTEDEAREIKKILGEENKVILVTSAYHMYRAKSLFEKEGIQVTTYPVDFKTGSGNESTILDYLPSAHSLALTETAFREVIGRLYYWVKN